MAKPFDCGKFLGHLKWAARHFDQSVIAFDFAVIEADPDSAERIKVLKQQYATLEVSLKALIAEVQPRFEEEKQSRLSSTLPG